MYEIQVLLQIHKSHAYECKSFQDEASSSQIVEMNKSIILLTSYNYITVTNLPVLNMYYYSSTVLLHTVQPIISKTASPWIGELLYIFPLTMLP